MDSEKECGSLARRERGRDEDANTATKDSVNDCQSGDEEKEQKRECGIGIDDIADDQQE